MVDSWALELIREGIALREVGDSSRARELLATVWERVKNDDPFERCFLAHSMADVQTDPAEELRWDLLALAMSDEVTEERAAEQGISGGRDGLYPSLHLNLAEGYLKLDDVASAKEHYLQGLKYLPLLSDNEYGRLVRRCFADFSDRSGVDATDPD